MGLELLLCSKNCFMKVAIFSILQKYSRSDLCILDSQPGGDVSMLFHGNQKNGVNVSYFSIIIP